MRKKNNNEKKVVGAKYNNIVKGCMIVTLFLVLVLGPAGNVLADGDPITVVNNLSDFIFQITKAVGVILIGYALVQIGLSFSTHDPSQRSNGVMFLTGGVIVYFAKEILTKITG